MCLYLCICILLMHDKDDSMSTAVFLILIHLLVLFGFFFVASRFSGWSDLADRYRFRGKFRAEHRWILLSARMGTREPEPLLGVERPLFPFRSALNMVVNEDGLRFSLFPIFRLFHPPLFVPWQHISVKHCTGLSSDWLEFRFKEAPSVVLRLRKSIESELAKFAPSGKLGN